MILKIGNNEYKLTNANISYYRVDDDGASDYVNMGIQTDTPDETAAQIVKDFTNVNSCTIIAEDTGEEKEISGYTLFSVERTIDDSSIKQDLLRINLRKE